MLFYVPNIILLCVFAGMTVIGLTTNNGLHILLPGLLGTGLSLGWILYRVNKLKMNHKWYIEIQMGVPASFEEGQAIENSKQLGIVTSGALRVTRDDGHSLDLREGYFVGELAYLGNRPNKVGARLTALTKAQVTWWSHDLMAELKEVDPPLYASFMQSIARDVAIKLSQPMAPPPGGLSKNNGTTDENALAIAS